MPLPSAVRPGSLPAPLAGLEVLVVDDNADCAFLLEHLLTRLGYKVHCAADGSSALIAALVHPPDVVLLDLGLPDINGYEVAARLRNLSGPKLPFIIALSGSVDDDRQRRAAGINWHLVKPVEPDELRQVLQRFGQVTQGLVAEVEP